MGDVVGAKVAGLFDLVVLGVLGLGVAAAFGVSKSDSVSESSKNFF